LVKNVLGCPGCHTPQLAAGGADMSKFLSGVECFAKDATTSGCLKSANLTNDDTGLKKKTDQQIKDAFTKGLDPDAMPAGSAYLFSQMPYYQFANLSDDDANAIVAYLRTVTPVVHAAPDNGAPFNVHPAVAQWAPVVPASLPAPVNAAPADAASAANGKYLATLACSTCHTPNTSATAPLQLDASKGFQGGKEFTTSLMVNGTPMSKKIQSANLTPDATGLKDWTPAQIAAAIKTAKDDTSVALCSPMRGLPNITDQDALDIAVYLKAIAPVANARTELCQ